MTTATTRGAGRPLKEAEALRPRSFRCTEKQAEKLDRLGGAEWIRAQIDAAPMPRRK